MTRLIGAATLLALALALGACSSAPAAPAQPAEPAQPGGGQPAAGTVHVSADTIAFDRAEVRVPAGKPFKLAFENRESAPHNVAIFRDSTASQPIFVGEIFGGPAVREAQVPALAPGSYFFRCDLHHNMTGTIVAE